MTTVSSLLRPLLSTALLLTVMAMRPASAADLQCADKEISARGPGFEPAPELSMDAAKKEWLKKATAVFSDAKPETAKKPQMVCASQGLYSNCTFTGIPCGTTPAPAAPAAKTP